MRHRDERRPYWMAYLACCYCISLATLGTAASVQAQEEATDVAATETANAVSADQVRSAKDDRKEELRQVDLADGRLTLSVPVAWKQVEPRSRIIEREFAVPAPEDEQVPGRLTMMQSGGGVKANIERWKGQFTPEQVTESDEDKEVEELEVAGLRIHVVDLSGTFLDQPGPFAPGTRRAGYRMLGAIIETEDAGDYYLKFYGPAATIAAHREAFDHTIRSLRWEDR